MIPRPAGTVTFLFTDIQGSTRSWESYPNETRAALARHDEIAAKGIEAHDGALILERGEGDSVFAVFARASNAVAAACDIQRAFAKEKWPPHVPVRVRMAIHTGEAGADYRGPQVNRAARIRAIAHGEQILISSVTEGIVRGALPFGASLADLGRHRLRDVSEMEHVFQLEHPDLRRDFPPLKSLGNYCQNLPIQLTSLVGREQERKTVGTLLGAWRLVTLIGSAGCGKTRLGIQVASDLLEDFPHGVRFVDLAPLSEPSLVLDTIAAAVGVTVVQGVPTAEALLRILAETKTLIVLDNCEHLLSSCAQAVSSMLRTENSVRVLATSQRPLGMLGEKTWRVPSLGLPNPAASLEDIGKCEAIELFVTRAIGARQDFALTKSNAKAITEICRTLDGMPLAIELAAARAKALTPREICNRLCDRFRLLIGGHGRHQTLRMAIDWSYDLLSENEKALFRRLSVFAGGFDFAAVEAIWPGDDLLNQVEQLVETSLLTVERADGERSRYRLLESLRQYGKERLATSGETQDALERHFAYYLAVAERIYEERIENEAASLGLLEADHDDFRAALRWARAHPTRFLELASVLGWFWHLHSAHYQEGQKFLEDALALNVETQSKQKARALSALSNILSWQGGDTKAARQVAEQSARLWREIGDPLELALALESVGWSELWGNGYREALRSMEECLDLYQQFGSQRLVTRGRVAVGQVLAALGEVERTEKLALETLAEGRAQREPVVIHRSLHYLGDCELWRGNPRGAVSWYGQSLRAALDYGNDMEAATEMQGIAMALAGSGREIEAFQLFGAACVHFEELHSTAIDEIEFWVKFRERYLVPARERIGAATADSADRKGREISWQDAISQALGLASEGILPGEEDQS